MMEKRHAERLERNRMRAPRASRLASTLFDLSKDHGLVALETLAVRVDGDFASAGVELSDDQFRTVFYAAVKAMADASRS